jgi:hypothetical protein
MAAPSPELLSFVAQSLARPAPPAVQAFAVVLRQRHAGVQAILAYGSSLRGVDLAETLIDYYLLTDDFRGVSSNAVSRLGCALAPPNVYYAEHQESGQALRAKYAVLPLCQFARWMERDVDNPYFWARFAQPTACLFTADTVARQQLIGAIATAIATCFANAKATTAERDVLAIWTAGFAATYGSEFRSESTARAGHVVETFPEYYRRAGNLVAEVTPIAASPLRTLKGKAWSLLRLAKAAFTFQGGADYLAWKIERHSGQKIVLSPWQRRHPVLAGVIMLPGLLRRGAVR